MACESRVALSIYTLEIDRATLLDCNIFLFRVAVPKVGEILHKLDVHIRLQRTQGFFYVIYSRQIMHLGTCGIVHIHLVEFCKKTKHSQSVKDR